MTGPSHARIGAAVGVVVGHLAGAEQGFRAPLHPLHLPGPVEAIIGVFGMAAVCGFIGSIAALLPDMDTPSTLGSVLPGWWHELTPGHRRGTHSLLAVALWWASMAGACAALGITGRAAHLLPALVVAGVASHLAADALTDHGIRPFYPLPWHLRLLGIKTGSWPEPVIVALACVGAGAWVVVGA